MRILILAALVIPRLVWAGDLGAMSDEQIRAMTLICEQRAMFSLGCQHTATGVNRARWLQSCNPKFERGFESCSAVIDEAVRRSEREYREPDQRPAPKPDDQSQWLQNMLR
jgi:hypothetical protein